MQRQDFESRFEVLRDKLSYVYVAEDNSQSIIHAHKIESQSLENGLDPVENIEVLRTIAKEGQIYLQYKQEGNEQIPTGVFELIDLENALKLEGLIEQYPDSPFSLVASNQKLFEKIKSVSGDGDILYEHFIGVAEQGKGYGTLLMEHVTKLENVVDKTITCFIDLAENTGEKIALRPNENSYTVHMKAGYVVIGVAGPPVYDSKVTHLVFFKPSSKFPSPFYPQKLRLEGDAETIIRSVSDLTFSGYSGVSYDRKTHTMTFEKFVI